MASKTRVQQNHAPIVGQVAPDPHENCNESGTSIQCESALLFVCSAQQRRTADELVAAPGGDRALSGTILGIHRLSSGAI